MSRRTGASLSFVLLVVLLPGVLVAQSPELRIQTARDRIVATGLESRLLDARIAEGRAKGVPLDLVAAAVERRAEALIAAANALRPVDTSLHAPDLAAGADAIEAGIPVTAIQQVARATRPEDRSVAISVLTYLHRERSLPLDAALADVSAAVARGPEALRELPVRGGGAPSGSAGDARPPAGRAPGAGRPADAGGARGQPSGGGPPAGVPGPSQRPGAGEGGRGGGGGTPPGAGARPPGRGPDGAAPPGRGPGGGGPPGRPR